MAKIIKKDNSLNKRYKKLVKSEKWDFIIFAILFVFSLMSLAIFLLFGTDQNYYIIPIFLFLISIVFLFKGILKTEDIEILEAGIQGENDAAGIVAQLPDDYFCFTNVLVSFSGKSEIDMVIVGTSGVFIIETKNMAGTIFADVNKEKWKQQKCSRSGNKFEREFYSPIKQVCTHAYRLNGFLKENGVSAYINPIVFFANSQTKVNINTSDIAVFSLNENGDALLKEYILNNKQRLSMEKIKAICRLL